MENGHGDRTAQDVYVARGRDLSFEMRCRQCELLSLEKRRVHTTQYGVSCCISCAYGGDILWSSQQGLL